MLNEQTIAGIVDEVMVGRHLSSRGLAEALTERLQDESVTHTAVLNWLNGKNPPTTDFLVLLLLTYRDWRFDFALACLGAKDPVAWGEDGGVWAAARVVAGAEGV